jgi:hypothetical protein
MKKLAISVLIAIMLQSVFVGAAGAAHVSDQDIIISIDSGLGLEIPIESGEMSYELQEYIHNELLLLTGVEVDHYYIWLEVDGERVLAVDPAQVWY